MVLASVLPTWELPWTQKNQVEYISKRDSILSHPKEWKPTAVPQGISKRANKGNGLWSLTPGWRTLRPLDYLFSRLSDTNNTELPMLVKSSSRLPWGNTSTILSSDYTSKQSIKLNMHTWVPTFRYSFHGSGMKTGHLLLEKFHVLFWCRTKISDHWF